jgi:hypothetical protein
MTSFHQIEANRRNARLSTGPVTEEGKRRSRQNVVRHGLTAETVIDAWKMPRTIGRSKWPSRRTMTRNQLLKENWCSDSRACYGDCVAPPPLRPDSSRTKRAIFCSFGNGDRLNRERQKIVDSMYQNAVATEGNVEQDKEEPTGYPDTGLSAAFEPADHLDDLTRAFVRLNNLPTYPLDRLSRYEATLWRQACQILWTLQCLNRRKPWRFG